MLIDHLRAFAPASEYIAALDEQPVCSEVSRIEIIQGLRSAERATAETLFALIEWLPSASRLPAGPANSGAAAGGPRL